MCEKKRTAAIVIAADGQLGHGSWNIERLTLEKNLNGEWYVTKTSEAP